MIDYKKILRLLPIIAVSITAWLVTYSHHLVTIYNDSMSHLDISRLVVDNIQPGIAQLGSVWLPLNHVLYLSLIWNNWAWHSGFAGSFISMLAFVFSTIGIYKIIIELNGRKLGATIGAIAFALNPNLLYLQSTPLTEPLFLAMMIASSLYLIRYIRTHEPKYLVLAAIFTGLDVLTRYDGWFLVGVEALVLVVVELFVYKISKQKMFGNLLLLLTPSLVAMFLWFLWNYLIFGSALYSFTGPYSAHAQQAVIQAHSGLITKSNLLISSKAFLLDVIDNTGILVVVGGTAGWVAFLLCKDRIKYAIKWLCALLLAGDIIFNVLALYAGFSILNIPSLHWDPTHTLVGEYFNVRYGITALPFIAVGFGLLISKVKFRKNYIAGVLLFIIVLQGIILLHYGLITIKDGTIGSSSFVNQDISAAVKKDVKPGQKIIISSSSFSGVMFESGLDLKQIINEGDSNEWKAAIANPYGYAQWIVIANGDVGDPVYNSLVVKEKDAFMKKYKLVYEGKHADLYERRTPFEQYVDVDQTNLTNDDTFTINGLEDYDLAYESRAQINNTFKGLKSSHINTVRFWLFGNGFVGGFQPTAGQLNNSALDQSDYILAEANQYKIRLIPVLVTNDSNDGGAAQYISWLGLPSSDYDEFFTDPSVIALYENYINHILSRTNSITHVEYKNDTSILAWDIMNDPQADSLSDENSIANWSNIVAKYIKGIDPNHLVTISLNQEETGPNVGNICSSRYIDFCSIQVNPTNNQFNSSEVVNLMQEKKILSSYSNSSTVLMKPIEISGDSSSSLMY
jgi:hypothetical protein